MITENSVVKGLHGYSYQMGPVIGTGGEGTVFAVQDAQLVAKIYKNVDPNLEGKLRYMVSHPIPRVVDQNGNPVLTAAWPEDIIYDGFGNFVGYIMPRISGGIEIFEIEWGCTTNRAKAQFPNYTWRLNVLVARNLAASVNILHSQGYVIGDMNCKNILVDSNGAICLLDTDSIDLTDPATGMHYKCCVGTEDYLAPELQGRNLRAETARFTEQADNFALAVHIFRLLMNNYHPFSGKRLVQAKASSNSNPRMQQIVEGKCPYLHQYSDLSIPVGAPRLEDILPDYMIQDFQNTFNYTASTIMVQAGSRTSAKKWTEDLRRLLQECDGPGGLIRCERDSSHFYLRSMGQCGMCKAQNPSIPIFPPPAPTPRPTPAPAPKKRLWPSLVLILAFAIFLVCALASPSGAKIENPTVIRSGQASTSEDIESVVEQGPTGSYRYQDGSILDLYFDSNDLERCRVYRDKSGNAEYIFLAEYNSDGNMLSHVTYDGQGNPLRTDLYTYDSNGNLTEKCVYLDDGQLAEKTIWTYLADGRDNTMECRAGDGTLLRQGTSTYDTNGYEVYKSSSYDGSHGESTYDAQGNCIRYISYDSSGKMNYHVEHQYDTSGRQTGYIYYNADGIVESRFTYTYDASGRRTGSKYYSEIYQTSSEHIITYAPHDVEVGGTSVGDGYTTYYEDVQSIIGTYIKRTSVYKSEYYPSTDYTTYNLLGNILEYKSYDEDGTLRSESEYEYDAYGYLLKRTFTHYSSYDGSKSVTVYDGSGNEISSARYDASGKRIK